jgi:hypothetical protein
MQKSFLSIESVRISTLFSIRALPEKVTKTRKRKDFNI